MAPAAVQRFSLSLRDLAQLYRTQADAIDAGLDRLASTSGPFTANLPPALARALHDAALAGRTLSAVFIELGLVDSVGAALLSAAEARGGEAKALRAMSEQCLERLAAQRRLIQGLVYPCLLLVAVIVIPPLPLLVTQGGGAYAKATVPTILSLLLLGALFLFLRSRPLGTPLRRAIDGLLAAIPPFSRISLANSRARFAEVLGSCLSAGLDARASIRWATRAAEHPEFHSGPGVVALLARGDSLYDALSALPGLDAESRAMIGQAEKAGKLDEVLPRVAVIHQERARAVTRITLGVAIFLISAVVMGTAAMAIFSGYSGYLKQVDQTIEQNSR